MSLAAGVPAAGADMTLPRIAVLGLNDQINHCPVDVLRSTWVFSYLNTEGFVTRNIGVGETLAGFNLLYCEGPLPDAQLAETVSRRTALIQSLANPSLPGSVAATSPSAGDRIRLHETYHRGVRVLTIEPHIAAFFENRSALPRLVAAIQRLCGSGEGEPRRFGIMPHPDACLTSVIYVVHGEGQEGMRFPGSHLFEKPDARYTYVVNEASLEHYPDVIARRLATGDEVGIHNHVDYGSAAEAIARNEFLQRVILGHRPQGLIGPFLSYRDDLFEALAANNFAWYLDKDIPYPVNIAGTDVIDITETVKPYDDWWMPDPGTGAGPDYAPMLSLWRSRLAQNLQSRAISVFHWHDSAMVSCPDAFESMIRIVNDSPRIWQCTASEFQDFWAKRSRVELHIESITRETITYHVRNAFAGLTIFAQFEDGARYHVLAKNGTYGESAHLAAIPEPSSPRADSLRVEYSDVLGSQTAIEFAIVNESDTEFTDHVLTLVLPDRLLRRVTGTEQEWSMQIVRCSIKGLRFETVQAVDPIDQHQIVKGIRFTAPHIAPRSTSFYRLSFAARLNRLEKLRGEVRAFAVNNRKPLALGTGILLAISITLSARYLLLLRTLRRRVR